MLAANHLPGDLDEINNLFEQFSVSLDNSNKFLRHNHIVSKPKLKRLLKLKHSPESWYPTTVTVCSRCKKESLKGAGNGEDVGEKEVEVRKEVPVKGCEKKVTFGDEEAKGEGETFEKAEFKNDDELQDDNEAAPVDSHEEDETQSEATTVHFQSVFFAGRPSIIGNNEFWLPKCSALEENRGEAKNSEEISTPPVTEPEKTQSSGESGTNLMSKLTLFLNSILSSSKPVKILQVVELLDNTIATLSDEHLFKCRTAGTSFEIVDVVALKEVRKIMVSESNQLLVLEVCHASTLLELKEFVPGCSQKTESLISLMVYALSRIQNVLLDVIRLPLLKLPTCQPMATWLDQQKETLLYIGITTVENVSYPDAEDLSEESFMMKISGRNQFHPVLLLLRAGFLTSKCNGGCPLKTCKYSFTLELTKEKVSVLRREDKPWPNCVRLITLSMDVIFASSRKASVDDLMDKLYSCIQPLKLYGSSHLGSKRFQAFVLVTQLSLQMFTMDRDKISVFGSPLLNLEIFDEDVNGMSCIIDSQGVEVDAVQSLDDYSRWHLTFLNESEKSTFLSATSIN